MAHITISNVGPIRDASFELNKVNVFMGPQSSGKSTIAKIISYCSWYEKNVMLHPSNRPDFFEELIRFHNLEESYFSEGSSIRYESEVCMINALWGVDGIVDIKFKAKNDNVFKNRKILYIPAERNFVTLPGLGRYNETRDNILSFMYEWFLAKKDLSEDNAFVMPIDGLGEVTFHYDKASDMDTVTVGTDRQLRLHHASSGLRSSIPLLVVFNYLLDGVYRTRRAQTPFELLEMKEKLNGAATEEEVARILGAYVDYHYSQVIIEEPELNLFPKTQQELIYYMVSKLKHPERDHQLVVTTHSPFILFAINNCVMGGLVGDLIPREERKEFPSYPAWICPKDVSIFEIHEGTIRCIQDSDGIIEDNYLNQAYKENADEYLSMLNYYEDEE